MTDLVAKILSDRALVRAFDDDQLKIIEGVLRANLPAGQAEPAPSPVAARKDQPATASAPAAEPIEATVDNTYIAYVDGACSGNPGPGGWAAYFPASQESRVGGDQHTTNNQMEIVAAIAAVSATPAGAMINIYTDSQLVVETMRGAYKRKSNIELWGRLDAACKGRTVFFTWIKGHDGHEHQEKADELAQREAQRRKLLAAA